MNRRPLPALPPAPRKRRARPGREGRTAALFLLPSLLGTAVFVLLPFAETVRRSFFDGLGCSFTGLANYRSVLQNSAFRLAAGNTARFLCTCVPVLLLVSLGLALGVRAVGRRRDGRPTVRGNVFRTSFLLPMAIPVASIVVLWQALFAQNGLVNGALQALGAQPVDFMGTGAAFWVLVFTYVWKNSGYDMILWLAGLDGIPGELYEAAAVDGANARQQFFWITLPNLLPTLALVGVLSLLNSFKAFREAFLVGGAYPHESMYLLQHLFNNWFLSLDLPRLTAAAVLTALALSGLILALQRFWTKGE
ncbi:carbohydrate ABC transporter permease [uncultured Subdoligranulum sp.]|uniref:carbohydrate ABC transporter permease n=1 Tax=uncultured Subdoligranulum sp. TaxID=512298 RepID=UPI002639C64F|nr:sugar ABC transporter permease [uncultured Subdoligranulum sp.]